MVGKAEYNDWLGAALLFGIGVLLLFAIAQCSFNVFAIGLLIAGAATSVGILVGFLFGIPRTLRKSDPGTPQRAGDPPAPASSVNTNLEEISDWLTKIIVGVGLVQLHVVPEKMMEMADYLSDAFGSKAPIPAPVVNLIVWYFGAFSFLLGYLWTRLYLAREFDKAEREAREKAELYEGAIHASLYAPPPTGFEKALGYFDYYKKHFGEPNARVWCYMTAAHAQKYDYESQEVPPKKQEDLDKIRDNALDAARRAIKIDAESRKFLYEQWKEDAPPSENDLQVFKDDPGFKKLFKDLLEEKPAKVAATTNPAGGETTV